MESVVLVLQTLRMPKVDVFSLPSLAVVSESIKLTDPNQPNVEIELQFKALDIVDYNYSQELTSAYYDKYCGSNALPFPGEQFKLSRPLIETACNAYVMQLGDDKYTVEEWLVLSYKMPQAWSRLVDFLIVLTNKGPMGKVASGSEVLPEAPSESR